MFCRSILKNSLWTAVRFRPSPQYKKHQRLLVLFSELIIIWKNTSQNENI